MSLNHYYVYVYLDPRKKGNYEYGKYVFEYEPYYVGKGNGDRYITHLRKAKRTSDVNYSDICNPHMTRRTRNILDEKLEPIILLVSKELEEQEAYDKEKEYIQKIGRSVVCKGPLTNLCKGGAINSGHIVPEERKKKISQTLKNHPNREDLNKRCSKGWFKQGRVPHNKGKHMWSPEDIGYFSKKRKAWWEGLTKEEQKNHTRKVQESRKINNYRHSEEAKQKMSKASLGKKKSASHCIAIGKASAAAWLLTSPTNISFKVVNLKQYCSKEFSDIRHMYKYIRRPKGYKGWKAERI